MENLIKDIRYGIRMLMKNPGVSLVAVITLALGIGANTAIFSGVSAFLMRPLSVPNPNDLVRPMEIAEDRGVTDEFSYPDFLDYRDQSTSFSGLAAEDMLQAAIDAENQNDVIWGQVVSANYFDLIEVKPILGRTFLPEEDKNPGANAVVVLSHSFWQRRLGSDPNVVGKTVQLNNRGYQVIGVTPDYFVGTKFALALDFWTPMSMAEDLRRNPGLLKERGAHWMNVIGRLKPGVSLSQASAEMSAIATRLNQTYSDNRAASTQAQVLYEIDGRWAEMGNVFKSGGAIAMAIVGLVLLIACANVANLMLARAAARRKEIGIRLALGANRARLVRQLLTESILLSIVGGGLGLLLAFWVTDLMQAFVPILEYNIVKNFFAIDSRALVFTLIISLATGLVFGLAPAWHSSNPNVVPVLKGDPEVAPRGRRRAFSLRNVLVVAQVALSLVVLICGGLFIKSFRKAQTMDPGFDNSKGLFLSLSPTLVGYEEEQSRSFYKQVLERVSHVPGVEAASFIRTLPLGDSSNSNGPILKEGETLPRGSAGRNIMNTVVSRGYFNAMQIPLIEGRDFDERDTTKTKRVIVINQRMAEMLWPGESAVGKRIFIGSDSRDGLEVVGVVKTGKYRALAEDPKPFYYSSMDQRRPTTMALVIRPTVDPVSLVGAIRSELQAIDRRVPVFAVKTMDQHKTYALWAPNMAASFSLAFGVLAILLSAVGLYSVMAYVVSQRTREVGIRMALGANRADVMKMITRQGMRLAAVGVGIGLLLALAVAQVLSSLLIGISGYDVTTFVLVPALLAVVALVACYLPARRATKVDPLVALRYE
ncbi:MAG TPA: ABC transporter permease [Pyrinomonadaceae bacterium]|jgi:putative ABC transport system permease protein|nr:ABC transporter permease [Pyrinomonadaceae bacterium]